jgi:hypothetical protein
VEEAKQGEEQPITPSRLQALILSLLHNLLSFAWTGSVEVYRIYIVEHVA